MSDTNYVWFGMKVTPEQKEKIKHLAEREQTSAKEAVMRLVEEALEARLPEPEPESFLAAVRDLAGSAGADGDPPDLSSNPRHLDGFGR